MRSWPTLSSDISSSSFSRRSALEILPSMYILSYLIVLIVLFQVSEIAVDKSRLLLSGYYFRGVLRIDEMMLEKTTIIIYRIQKYLIHIIYYNIENINQITINILRYWFYNELKYYIQYISRDYIEDRYFFNSNYAVR